ncbi:MAG: DUF4124 domain-containing protein [Methylococcales bacterium]|nr:DUF4124 domain-containing protein [Methylococcales bacterium]
MKLIRPIIAILATTLFSGSVLAGVFKCTDAQGNTAYQSAPCAEENIAAEIDLQTGGHTDLTAKQKQQQEEKELDLELKKQQEAEKQKQIDLEEKRKKDAAEQGAINQQLIKDNPIQFSVFAIPPYTADELPALVKQFEARLPEIEKFRRLAAQKALATGECIRVEVDELSVKSKADQLVIKVDCSSAKTFRFNEAELVD